MNKVLGILIFSSTLLATNRNLLEVFNPDSCGEKCQENKQLLERFVIESTPLMGPIYKCVDKLTGVTYACKIVGRPKRRIDPESGIKAIIPIELEVLDVLASKHIPLFPKLNNVFYLNDTYFVTVMEFLGEDWTDLQSPSKLLSPAQIASIMHQWVEGIRMLFYLNPVGYSHSDIKCNTPY